MNTGNEEEVTLYQHEHVSASWGEDPLMDDVMDDEDETASAPQSHLRRRRVFAAFLLLVFAALAGVVAWQLTAGDDATRSTGENAAEGTPQDLFQPTIAPSMSLDSTSSSPSSLFSGRLASYPTTAPSVAFQPFTRRPTRTPKSMSLYTEPTSLTLITPLFLPAPVADIFDSTTAPVEPVSEANITTSTTDDIVQ
jgi:hypothetical protein